MKNLAMKNNFRLDIPDSAFDNFVWQIQNLTIPGVSLEIAPIVNGPKYAKIANNHVAGSATSYDDLTITFIVDEELLTYKELLSWMLTMNNPTGGSEFEGKIPATMLLHILDNNKDKIMASFKFINPFPKSIGDIEWTYTEQGDVDAITCDVTFEYSYFDMLMDGKTLVGPVA
ncbi:tail tube [Vibrio phage D479]